MKRQLLTLALMAALAAVPVRADDRLLYLAGRPADSQMGSDQLRDRLKDFLSRSESVSAPVRRAEPTQDVAALSVEIPVPQKKPALPRTEFTHRHEYGVPKTSESPTIPEELVLPREVKVAALTVDGFDAPIPVEQAETPQEPILDPRTAELVPEEVVLPPSVRVAALSGDAFHAPVPTIADMAALDRVLDRDHEALAPEEIVFPADVQVAALSTGSFAAPIPEQTAPTSIAPRIEFALPVAQRAVDDVQVAHFTGQDRTVVFEGSDDAIATLGLTPITETTAPPAGAEPIAEEAGAEVAAEGSLTQVAAAGPVQLVPEPAASGDDTQVTAEPRLHPRPLPRPNRGYTQLASLSTGPAPTSQAISIDGRGKPLTIQAGKGRMLRLPEAVDTVFVAQPDIADIQMKSPRLLYLFGRQPGETTIYATTKDDTVVFNQRIQVAHNLDPLNELIRVVHSESVIEVRSLNNTVMLTGLVPDVATAENIFQLAGQVLGENGRVMNRIKVAGVNQVNLRVRIAEVRREISKELGFNWDVLRTTGSLAIGFATAGFGSITSATTNVITTEAASGSLDVNSVIDALDDEGLISVLAEPNLTAMNGEVANFLAGGEFSIPIAQGDDTISITFKQFGVSLSFSPQVLEKGRINIKVLTEVSQLSQAGAVQVSGFSVPALTTRRAETTVELRSGQSFAIAGLLQNVINQSIEEFPGLADLPIIGPLFKSEQFQRDETELLVVVTPYLVRPTNAQIALPMDGYVAPTDTERLLRQTNRPRVPDNNKAPRDRGGRPGSVGEAGFIVR